MLVTLELELDIRMSVNVQTQAGLTYANENDVKCTGRKDGEKELSRKAY